MASGRTFPFILPPVRGGACAVLTGAMQLASATHAWLDPEGHSYERYTRKWAGFVLRTFGVEVAVEGNLPGRRAGARMVIANHRSPLDIVILLHLVGGRFLSRADVAQWPLIGRGAQKAGVIFVDRDDRSSGARAIRTMRKALRSGETVIAFPEGSTSVGDRLNPFRAGAFVSAKGLDVELLPVGFAYPPGCEFWEESFTQHVRRVSARPRTPVAVCFGSPQAVGARSPNVLAEVMQHQVEGLVRRARAALR